MARWLQQCEGLEYPSACQCPLCPLWSCHWGQGLVIRGLGLGLGLEQGLDLTPLAASLLPCPQPFLRTCLSLCPTSDQRCMMTEG